METLSLKIKSEGILLKDPARAIKIWEDEIMTGLERALAFLHGRISMRMPESVTSNLRGSLVTEIRGRKLDLHGVVGTPAKYALTIERGWRVGKFPNIDAIKKWARSRLGPTGREESRAYLIARAIYRKGYKKKEGWRMFEDTFKDDEKTVIKILNDANKRVLKRLGGS